MKYIYLYQNENEYNADSTRVLPAVSYCQSEETVYYSPAYEMDDYIEFADPIVEQIITDAFGTNGKITYSQAAAVTEWFEGGYDNNTTNPFYESEITSFNEFQYFTGITEIRDYAFFGCENLTSMVLPRNITYIGMCAFYPNISLTNINIPYSVEHIGSIAFGNKALKSSIYIPSSTTYIGEFAFRYCNNVRGMAVNENNPIYDSRNNCNAIIETATNTMLFGCNNTTIPDSVEIIGKYFCDRAENITSINIPDSVTTINEFAFARCGNTDLHLGKSVSYLGDFAFRRCDNLTHIDVDIENTTFDSRNNCNAIIETASNELVIGCKNTTIPNSIESIGFEAFFHCEDLCSIDFPNTLKHIDIEAFYKCYGLTNVVLPSSLESISVGAFGYCENIISVTCNATIPPTLITGNYSPRTIGFSDTTTIYVPAESVDAYKAADGWSEYANRIFPITA